MSLPRAQEEITLFGYELEETVKEDEDGRAYTAIDKVLKTQSLLTSAKEIDLADKTSQLSIFLAKKEEKAGAPNPAPKTLSDYQWTLGDLNSNTLKLINFLKQIGVWAISDEDYLAIKRIFDDGFTGIPDAKLKDESIVNFKKILDDAKFVPAKMVRLIGDELADRGNDFYTLLILNKLVAEVPLEIILSNHGTEFITAFENEDEEVAKEKISDDAENRLAKMEEKEVKKIGPEAAKAKATAIATEKLNKLSKVPKDDRSSQYQSQAHLAALSGRGVISSLDEIKRMIENLYSKSLRAISYSYNLNKSISIFTHARSGLNAIWQLADAFYIDTSEKTVDDLMYCIDMINQIVHEFAAVKRLTQLMASPAFKPLFDLLIENRSKKDLSDCPRRLDGQRVYYFHGHETDHQPSNTSHNIYNLDDKNTLGKTKSLEFQYF